MYKKLTLLTFLSLSLLWSCGEAGLESDISKVNEIEFTVSNITSEGVHFENASVNLADEEFADYLGDIEQFKVNKMEVQITAVSGDLASIAPYGNGNGGIIVSLDGSELLAVVYFGGSNGTTNHQLFHDGQGNLISTEKIVLYDEANPSNVQIPSSQEVVNILISALENRSTLNARVGFGGKFENANITLKVFLDLTARAQLN